MQAFRDGKLVDVTPEDFVQALYRHANWADEEFSIRADPAAHLGLLMTQAANELDRLMTENALMLSALKKAESMYGIDLPPEVSEAIAKADERGRVAGD